MSWSADKVQVTNSAQNEQNQPDNGAQEDINQRERIAQSDSEYDEEDDDDYNPEAQPEEKVGHLKNGAADDDEDKTLDNDKEYQKLEQQYKSIESGGTAGGLVKTRRARLLEKEAEQKQKYDNVNQHLVTTSNVSSVWDNLKKRANVRLQTTTPVSALREATQPDENTRDSHPTFGETNETNDMSNKIKIKRTYEFAGQQHTEEKYVLKNSAEAKEYLHSLKFNSSLESSSTSDLNKDDKSKGETKERQNGKISGLRRPLKRPPILEKIIAGSLKPKLSTLEKSKMDWAGFVDNEGIYDELQQNNKAGYMQRQEFLHRVDKHKDVQYKKMRQKELAEKFKSK
ncbi:hypothetical protein ACO0QE_003428 [Hanseniaspora vineae]